MNIPIGMLEQPTAVIPISTTTSQALPTSGASLVGVMLPAAFTGTSISFTIATTLGGTYNPLYNSSGQVTYTVAANRFVAINPQDFYGVIFFKIVSNATELAARNIVCSLKGI